jgi:anti-sigma factor RsiW
LSAYLEHDLGDDERAEMDAHLGSCSSCVQGLAELRAAVDLLRRMPDPEPPPFHATRVMARIAAGEARSPLWRRWLEQLGAPLVAAPVAAAAAALAVFTFSTPPSETALVVASAAPEASPGPPIVVRQVGTLASAQLVVPLPRPDPGLIARYLRGASHPHSMALAGHFDDPVRAVAYQSPR